MAARLRVLLDACVTQKLRNDITGHDVETARYAGLADVDDRALLDAMAGRFDVLVTLDKSIPYHNVVAGRPLAVILLRAPSSQLADLKALVPYLLAELEVVTHGEVRVVTTPTPEHGH